MDNPLVKLLKEVFGEVKPPEKYDKIETLVVNGDRYEMEGWQGKDMYFVQCERLKKIVADENEVKAFDKMGQYICSQTILKRIE